MTVRNSLHYCYDVSYQCWFESEKAKIYCNNFNSSNAVVCSNLILAFTVRLAIMNAVELERNGWFFFYLYWGYVVLWLKRTLTKKLANRISYQIWYKGCFEGKFEGGPKSAKGGPYPLTDLDWGVQIRGDTGWDCVTKGNIFMCARYFFFFKYQSLPQKIIPEIRLSKPYSWYFFIF